MCKHSRIFPDSDAPVCQGNPLQSPQCKLSWFPNVTYKWSGPNGYNSNGPNQTVLLPATGTYTVTVLITIVPTRQKYRYRWSRRR